MRCEGTHPERKYFRRRKTPHFEKLGEQHLFRKGERDINMADNNENRGALQQQHPANPHHHKGWSLCLFQELSKNDASISDNGFGVEK